VSGTFPGLEATPQELKRALSMAYVCARLGIVLDDRGRALCPWHDDHSPSLEVWEGDDGQRIGCKPCDKDFDIIGLVREKLHQDFGQALDTLRRFLLELPPDYVQPTVQGRVRARPEDLAGEVAIAQQRAREDPGAPIVLAVRGGFGSPGDDPRVLTAWGQYLIHNWGWGIDPVGTVVVPHWGPDGTLTGAHKRHADGTKGAISGSSFPNLYGSWRPRQTQRIFIAEGETDTAYAAYMAAQQNEPIDVYGLPSGAQQAIDASWVHFIRGARYIYLGLDPDEEGVKATRRWIEEFFSQAGSSWDVRVCILPLGKDLRSARADISRLLRSAVRPLPYPVLVSKERNGYAITRKSGDAEQVTNWTVEPVAQLAGGDDPGYDVTLEHAGVVTDAVLRLSDMASVAALNRWANGQRLLFTGTDFDRRLLAEWVKARGHVTPEIFQTTRVGMHEPPKEYSYAGPTIVYPNRHYDGDLPWRYAPTQHTSDVTGQVYLPAEPNPDWGWLETFLQLSSSRVTHPLLAWVVAAMRRPEARDFPMLFIGGSSGVGKSTLARMTARLAGSRIEVDLGTVTPFVLLRALSSSRSLPVFVDEWTRHSRKDTREAFQGFVPVLYSRGTAERGQSDLSSVRYELTAPTMVAGEDTFALDRERERIVQVHPTRGEQNPVALASIQYVPLQKIGAAIHSWLATNPDGLPTMRLTAASRPEYNRMILEAGWETLRAFIGDLVAHGQKPPHIPEVCDLSCFDADEDAAPEENIYLVTLIEGLSLTDANHRPLVWRDTEGKGTWVRARALVSAAERSTDIELPGRSIALLDYFRERFVVSGGDPVRPPMSTTAVRAHLIEGLDLPGEADAVVNPDLPI